MTYNGIIANMESMESLTNMHLVTSVNIYVLKQVDNIIGIIMEFIYCKILQQCH